MVHTRLMWWVYYIYMPPLPDQPKPQKHDDGAGPIIGAIIIVILLVFGALYFWGQKLNRQPSPDAPLVKSSVSID